MRTFTRAAVALTMAAGLLGAQKPMDVKTVELRHLTPAEAVKLLTPYVVSGGGGVFAVSDALPILTLRDTPEGIARMEQVLTKYDHQPATIRLVFQLIEADTAVRSSTATGEPRGPASRIPAELDSTLRSVLKYPSYQLLSQGVASAGELSNTLLKMAAAGDALPYVLATRVDRIRLSGSVAPGTKTEAGTVRLVVNLYRDNGASVMSGPNGTSRTVEHHDDFIETSVDVPLGHTVVLGTAATTRPGSALILTVRPELISGKP